MADHANRTKCESAEPAWMTEKQEGGRKRRYLSGVASGLAVDAHGEQMTEQAIASFLTQAQDTDILLYFNHGKDFFEDVAILVKSEKLENGDWFTVYRLYDEDDDVPEEKLKRIETVWRQINGLAPYQKKRQFGFSIEGIIPEGKIRSEFGGENEGTFIDEVQLDAGVTLVTRPAYLTSVAHAIEKAVKSWRTKKNSFDDNLQSARAERDFFDRKDELDAILERSIGDLFKSTASLEEKAEQFRSVYMSYVDQLVELHRAGGFRIFEDEEPERELDTAEKPRDQNPKKTTRVFDAAKQLQRLTVLAGKMKTKKNVDEALAIIEDLKVGLDRLGAAMVNDPDKEDPDFSEGPEDQEPIDAPAKEAEGNVSQGTTAEETVESVQPGVDPNSIKQEIMSDLIAKLQGVKPKEEPKSDLELIAPLLKDITEKMTAMNTNQATLTKSIDEIQDFNGELLKGYGISKEFTKEEPARQTAKAVRGEQMSHELKFLAEYIQKAAGGAESGGHAKPKEQITSKAAMTYLLGAGK